MCKELSVEAEIEMRECCIALMHGRYFCGFNESDKDIVRKMSNPEFFEEMKHRLSMVGYDLMYSDIDKTIYVNNQPDISSIRYNIDLLKSRVLLYLLKQYVVEIRSADTSNVTYYKWGDMLEDMSEYIKTNGDKSKIIDALWFFKDMRIISTNLPKKVFMDVNSIDTAAITIYPSIKYVCNLSDLNSIEETLASYTNSSES
jgi:hypothetical protein